MADTQELNPSAPAVPSARTSCTGESCALELLVEGALLLQVVALGASGRVYEQQVDDKNRAESRSQSRP